MRNVVIAVDSSDHSSTAFWWAVNNIFRKRTDPIPDRICIASVNDSSTSNAAVHSSEGLRAQQLLTKFAARLPTDQYDVNTAVLLGDPRTAILEKVKEYGAQLLIVGSRGLGPLQRMMMGSVSRHLIDNVPCPIVIAREQEIEKGVTSPGANPNRVIAISVDGSDHSQGAFWFAVNNVIRKDDIVALLTVDSTKSNQPAALVAASLETSRHLLAKFAGWLPEGEYKAVQQYVLQGDPHSVIVEKIKEINADAIVMGSRGLGGIKKALMGSVSSSVVNNCTNCPVFLVRGEQKLGKA